MAGCSCGSGMKFDGLSAGYRRLLWVVIAINAGMFLIEVGGGLYAASQALLADALDFLGDTLTYSITLLVIGMPLRWRARAALFKGVTLAVMGVWVVASTLYHLLVLELPRAELMGLIGFLALVANLTSVLLLYRYRNGDANVRSVWLCSRNDAIGNLAVLIAAAGVWSSASSWPDLVVAGIMATLFLRSATQIIQQARAELSTPEPLAVLPTCATQQASAVESARLECEES